MTSLRGRLATAALAALLSPALTPVPAAASPEPSPRPGCGAPPQHSVTVSPASIDSGATTTVTVVHRLEPCYPQESRSHEVTLYARPFSTGSATVVATGRTDDQGRVSFVQAPGETTDYADNGSFENLGGTRVARVIVDGRPWPSPDCASYAGMVDRTHVVAGEPVEVRVRIDGDGNGDHAVRVVPEGYTRRPLLTDLQEADFARQPGGGLPAPDGQRAARWSFTPTTSSRVWVGWSDRCHSGEQRSGRTEPALVVVAPRLTLTAVRHGVRDYTFRGVAVSRPGHQVSLYRVTADGREVLTAQTTSTPGGTWSVRRKFLGSGQFPFVLRTRADQANAAGSSSVRPTVIH